MHDTDNPIEAVRARLDGGRKWLQGDLGNPSNPHGGLCLLGACIAVKADHNIVQAIASEQYPDRSHRPGGYGETDLLPVAAFNDHPDTTWADVDLVLDKASVRWQEQVR